mmetsp:Transcript_939/g.3436  ORF Transcript_939/g.3436 Transcript_939/m.3436 type:complete len:998 (-) Transcript_939:40-3033(-)
MPTPFAMVSSAKAMVNLPKLSDLTINKSRSMRKSLGRERNRLARFALEEDSHLEGGDSQNAFGKNEEEEGKSEKLDEEEGASSSSQSATETTHSNVEASSSKFMALKKDTNNAKTTGGENTNKEQKNIRVARRRVNPATAAAVAKAKRETTVSSKGEENKKENNIEDTDEDEDETHTILVRQPFETSDLELELNDSDAKATTSGGSVKVKTERRVGKSGSKSSKNFIGGKAGANGINANKTKKEREEEDEEEEDEYAVSDWKKWNERFDQLAKEDEALVALNGQLAEAIDVEDYGRASTIRDAIEAALTVDPAMKIRRGFLRALETEDYGAAAKFRDSGAGLLGWWHGVDITDYLQSYSIERDKMHDYAYGVNGDQLVYKQPEREEEEEEEDGSLSRPEGDESGDDDLDAFCREGGGGGGERVDVKESIAGKITSWLRSALMGEKKIEEENVEVAVEEKEKETDDNEDEREESATIELIQEFVFFGRLERRKGVILFCDAIDALLRKLDVKPFKVTFLGSDRNKIDREPSKRFVERRSRPWREEKNRAKVTEVNVFTEKNSAEALRYLLEKGKRRLAVLPSLVENSPLSVFELFGVNAPFIASDAGGMPELVKRRTNVVLSKYEKKEFDILFPRNSVNALSEKLREILDHGFVTNAFESTVDVIKNEQRWVQFHKDVAMSRELMLKSSPSSSSPGAAVLRRMKKITEESEMVRDIVDMRAHNVSKGILIVVATRDVDEKLARTLKSISKQKHVKPKAVVVCTSSERNPAFHQVDKDSKNLDYDLSVVEKIGASLAVCRNFAFKTAILNREKNGFSEIAFVDAGNVLEPHALRVFQSALFRFDANVVTSFAHVYDGTSALAEDADIRKLTSANMRQFQPFLGAAFPVATTRNCMGGPVFMVTLNSLINHAGLVLFDKSHSDGYDVWEILSRLTLNGAKLEVIPRAMFWTGSVMKGTKYTKDDRAGRFATEKLREAVKKAPSPAEFRPIFREEKEKDEL